MRRYWGVEFLILIVGLALAVILGSTGNAGYAVLVAIPLGLAAGLYAFRFMKRREAEGRR